MGTEGTEKLSGLHFIVLVPRTNMKLTDLLSGVRDRGSTVVKVLCYKSEGRWFDFSLT